MRYDRNKSDELTKRRRLQIIEAAERSFRKRGFHATTLREIAAEFGMSVGHIYNYFSGKDAILEALIHQKIDDFLSILTRPHPGANTLRDRLGRIVDMYIDPEVAPIVLAVNSEALINESVLRILKASRQRMAEYIVDLVRKDGEKVGERTEERTAVIRHRVIATLAMLEGLHIAVLFDDVDGAVLREVVIDRLISLRDIEKELDSKRFAACREESNDSSFFLLSFPLKGGRSGIF